MGFVGISVNKEVNILNLGKFLLMYCSYILHFSYWLGQIYN